MKAWFGWDLRLVELRRERRAAIRGVHFDALEVGIATMSIAFYDPRRARPNVY